jgi:transposase-like protein
VFRVLSGNRTRVTAPSYPTEPKYLYRVVDKAGNTIDFLLRARRDKEAAQRYLEKSIAQNGEPETVTIVRSGANLAAPEAINAERETPIRIRQTKYLNNIIQQDHRAIKRRARILLVGIELMQKIAKGQTKDGGIGRTPAEQFYSLVE